MFVDDPLHCEHTGNPPDVREITESQLEAELQDWFEDHLNRWMREVTLKGNAQALVLAANFISECFDADGFDGMAHLGFRNALKAFQGWALSNEMLRGTLERRIREREG